MMATGLDIGEVMPFSIQNQVPVEWQTGGLVGIDPAGVARAGTQGHGFKACLGHMGFNLYSVIQTHVERFAPWCCVVTHADLVVALGKAALALNRIVVHVQSRPQRNAERTRGQLPGADVIDVAKDRTGIAQIRKSTSEQVLWADTTEILELLETNPAPQQSVRSSEGVELDQLPKMDICQGVGELAESWLGVFKQVRAGMDGGVHSNWFSQPLGATNSLWISMPSGE